MTKPSPVREDIIAVASLIYANGTPRYPQLYVACLFGISRSRVAQIMRENNQPRRRRYAKKERA
jgi:hypothetical protein